MNSPYTVVIPALNEEAAIGPMIDRLLALPQKPEIVIVDDGSTDKTADIARSKGCVVVHHPIPGGYGRAVKDGTKQASNEVIIVSDADGTYPIEDIPKMLAMFEKGYDMVVGARQGKHYRGSFFKMPARILLKWLVEFTTGRKIPDINSGFRIFRKSDMLTYERDLCNGFSFTTTITLVYMHSGKFVGYMPIDYFARIGKSKVRIFRDSLRTLQYITETILIYNPLKLFTLMATAVGIGSIALWLSGMTLWIDWAIIAGIVGIATCLIIFGLGLLATSVTRRV